MSAAEAAEELVPAGPPGSAVSEVAQLPPPDPNEAHKLIEPVWRFFCSLKLTLVNLLLLFLGMIAGTFVNPQNDSLANIEKAFANRPAVLAAYRYFELYDLFHSWWFTALLLSLALNLVACSLERLPRIWYLVRYPQRRLDHVTGLRFKAPPVQSALTAADVAGRLRKLGYSAQVLDGTYVFAERGRYARFGVWVVHLSLLLILGGGVFGRLTAFEGTASVPQNGGITTSFVQRNPDGSEFKHRLVDPDGKPFLVQCTDFRLKEFEPGRPKAFESDLVVFEDQGSAEPGRELARTTITVNHPLRYGGLTFYQASYSQLDEGSRAKITIADTIAGTSKTLMVAPGEPIDAAEGLSYRVVDYNPDFSGLGPAVQVVRNEDGRTSSFWIFARDPGFDRRNRADRFAFAFDRIAPLYATGLQIARDPSTPVIYTGCFLLFFGIGIAFYTSHKRVWAKVADGAVAVAGASHRNGEAFSREFDEIRAGIFA
ncbi:MAG TPA: cytochrome c biogenesis protein ResB [Myxococcales bacterium]|nr:cytochrome c biogenesis protein ResB [Myxococcales bacterium]